MTTDPAVGTQRAYDASALRYRSRWHGVDPLRDAKERFAALLPARGTVLDVGCGTGRDMGWFSAAGFAAIGLDRSLGMLRTVAPSLPLIAADMHQIPLRHGCIDGWWASASLLHLPRSETPTALQELRRVTRANGSGFLSVKEGTGEAWEEVEGTTERRFFCYWETHQLDALLEGCGWRILTAWTSDDLLGRNPWLCRTVRRA